MSPPTQPFVRSEMSEKYFTFLILQCIHCVVTFHCCPSQHSFSPAQPWSHVLTLKVLLVWIHLSPLPILIGLVLILGLFVLPFPQCGILSLSTFPCVCWIVVDYLCLHSSIFLHISRHFSLVYFMDESSQI